MTYIVAELGINHNGDLNIAKRLIDAAYWAKADAVKFQKRTVEIVYAGHLDDPRESPWGNTLGAQKTRLEFGKEQFDEIDRYCRLLDMPWFASAWDIPSLGFLSQYDCPYSKVASAMATNEEFLRAVRNQKRPVILSSAMCTDDQLWKAVNIVLPVAILHCVGSYPAPEADLNLNSIKELKHTFGRAGIKIGYSGHEASVSPSVMAVVLGAEVIERHLTLDRSMYGSDQAASLEPHAFKSMVEQIRKIPIVLGDGVRRITEVEKAIAKKLRYWEVSA